MIDTGFLLNLYLKSSKRRFGFLRFNMGFTLGLEKGRSFGILLCYCMKKKISVTCLLELLTMDLGFYMNFFFEVLWLFEWRLRH